MPASPRCSPARACRSPPSRSTTRPLARGRGHVEHSTDRAVSRGKLDPADRDAIFERIRFSTSLEDLAAAELVIEAVPERMELKAEVFAQLDKICPPDTILATNTSSLSVTELSVVTGRPSKVIGMHFFNPAPVMKLVEVVRTVVTEPSVVDDVEALAARLGKVDVTIGDKAGFIANALLFGYLNHAVSMYENRYASREDIDAAMRLGCGLPMGPLALMDLIGIDTAYEILDTMYKQSRNRLHAPSPVIKQMMTAGLLGRKSGRGFYTYAERGSAEVVDDAPRRPPAGPPRAPARCGPSASSAPARWPPGSSRSSPRAATTSASSPARPRRSRRSRKALTKSLDKQVVRGRLDEAGRDEVLGPGHRDDVAGRPRRPRPDHRGRRRVAAGQGGAVRQPRRDRQARRGARDDDVQPAGHRVRQGQRPPGRRRRACTSSTPRRS